MADDYKKRLAQLRALYRMSTAAVDKHSRNEAMNAIDQIHERAKKFGISMKEIMAGDDLSDRYVEEAKFSGSKNTGMLDRYLWRTIARFCSCQVRIFIDEDNDVMISYFGEAADVENAHWLRANLRAVSDFDWKVHYDFVVMGGDAPKPDKAELRDIINTFYQKFGNEVKRRMDLAVRRDTPTGRDLVSMKDALVVQMADKVDENGKRRFTESQGTSNRQFNHSSAAAAGTASGERADLGRGIGNRGVKMIQ
jgi:RNase P subunit RPR2